MLRPLFLEEGRRVRARRRQAHLVALDLGDEPARHIMVMTLVRALAAVTLRQLDAVAFDGVDRADGRAVGADDLHMLADLAEIGHAASPLSIAAKRCRAP